ncbi:MAG: MarR family winged helix-turn-helix transcriptional regulator [Deferribacterales bacterium]
MLLIKELPDKKQIRKGFKNDDDVDASSIITILTMLKTSSDVMIAIEKFFTSKGLSHSRFTAMSVLMKTDGGMFPNELADEMGISRATVSTIVKGMETGGLVETSKSDSDGRMKKIVITKKGSALYEELLPEYFAILSSVANGLNKKDMKSATESMQFMLNNLAKMKE